MLTMGTEAKRVMAPIPHYRTVPIVVSGATFAVTIKCCDGDWAGFEVDTVTPNGGSTWDMQPYLQDDVREAIEEKCIDMLDEIVASGFDSETW